MAEKVLADGDVFYITHQVAVQFRRVATGGARRVNAPLQLRILSTRNFNILLRDKLGLALMLLLAPGIGLMVFMWGCDLFDPVKGVEYADLMTVYGDEKAE